MPSEHEQSLHLPLPQYQSRDHPPAVMMYVRYPLSLRNIEVLVHECRIDKSPPPHATSGSFNPTALQADCPGFCRAAVAQLLEVVLPNTGVFYFTN